MTTRHARPVARPVAQRAASLSIVGLLSVAALAGCGSSSSTTAGSGRPSGFPSGGPGGFSQNPAQLKKIQACLKAAGIKTNFPQGRPSGFPSGAPSGPPSGSPPSGFPSGAPSGGFSGGPGGGFRDPKIQAALKACGITFTRPSGAPSG